jgi:hypothetical protein
MASGSQQNIVCVLDEPNIMFDSWKILFSNIQMNVMEATPNHSTDVGTNALGTSTIKNASNCQTALWGQVYQSF